MAQKFSHMGALDKNGFGEVSLTCLSWGSREHLYAPHRCFSDPHIDVQG